MLDADVATEVTAPALRRDVLRARPDRVAAGDAGRGRGGAPVPDRHDRAVDATQAGLASNLVDLLGTGLDPSWLAEHSARLAKVTVDEVSAAAAAFFGPARFVGVVVGDAGRIADPVAALTPVITELSTEAQ